MPLEKLFQALINSRPQDKDYLHDAPITTPPGPDGLSKIMSMSIMIPGSV